MPVGMGHPSVVRDIKWLSGVRLYSRAETARESTDRRLPRGLILPEPIHFISVFCTASIVHVATSETLHESIGSVRQSAGSRKSRIRIRHSRRRKSRPSRISAPLKNQAGPQIG